RLGRWVASRGRTGAETSRRAKRTPVTSLTTCDHIAQRSGILGSNGTMSAGDRRTTEPRIRISRRGGGNARCSGSRALTRFGPPDQKTLRTSAQGDADWTSQSLAARGTVASVALVKGDA